MSHFLKPFYYVFLAIFLLVLFLSLFFGPAILGGSFSSNVIYYDFSSTNGYLWPTPRLYKY